MKSIKSACVLSICGVQCEYQSIRPLKSILEGMSMTYGYCRISTQKQNIDRQVRNIRAAFPNALIVCETYTGTSMERPQWAKLDKALKSGDTVVFDSVSRMSRNASSGVELYERLYRAGVKLVFLKEPHINTATYTAALERASLQRTGTAVDLILEGIQRYLMELAREQIHIAFAQAQKEVDDLHQRTREGIEMARFNGKQIGQKPGAKLITKKSIAAKAVIQRHSKAFGGSLTDTECMKLIGLARNTFYKYKKEMLENC